MNENCFTYNVLPLDFSRCESAILIRVIINSNNSKRCHLYRDFRPKMSWAGTKGYFHNYSLILLFSLKAENMVKQSATNIEEKSHILVILFSA